MVPSVAVVSTPSSCKNSPKHRVHKESDGKHVEKKCDLKAQNPNLTPHVVDHSSVENCSNPLDAIQLAPLVTDLQDVRTDQRGTPIEISRDAFEQSQFCAAALVESVRLTLEASTRCRFSNARNSCGKLG